MASLRKAMNIDTRFPTKLDSIQDAPEPLRQALVDNFPSKESVRLLVHAPTFLTEQERSPATVLAVNNTRWLVASEKEDDNVSVQKCSFSETLFVELTSILLWGQLKIHFADAGENYSSVVRFDTVGEEFYREAIDLMLSGIDQTPAAEVNSDPDSAGCQWTAQRTHHRPIAGAVSGAIIGKDGESVQSIPIVAEISRRI